MKTISRRAIRAGVFWVAGGVSAALGQTNSEINSGLQFNFSSPGARSLSLGGAFIGLADDATAAYTNPAGLTALSKPEFSIEGRRFEYQSSFLSAGSASGLPTGNGVDSVNGPVFDESTAIVNDLSFASGVYPIGRLVLAVYWHELANFRASAQTEGAFFDDPDPNILDGRNRLFPTISSVRLRVRSVGGSAAYRFGDTLSVGVGVSRFDYVQNTTLTRYFLNSKYAPAAYDAPGGRETAVGDDSDVAVNVGLLWKPTRTFSIGAVFRQGPSFSAQAMDALLNPDGSVRQVLLSVAGKFHVPDVYGVGIAFTPLNSLTITADYDRVRYSQLTDGMVDVLNDRDRAVGYVIDDGNEAHLGVQFARPVGIVVIAVRAGSWYDPDHKIRYTQDSPASQVVLFRGGKNVFHYSGGLGIAIGEHFQIDAAGDFASTVKTGSVSTVVRF